MTSPSSIGPPQALQYLLRAYQARRNCEQLALPYVSTIYTQPSTQGQLQSLFFADNVVVDDKSFSFAKEDKYSVASGHSAPNESFSRSDTSSPNPYHGYSQEVYDNRKRKIDHSDYDKWLRVDGSSYWSKEHNYEIGVDIEFYRDGSGSQLSKFTLLRRVHNQSRPSDSYHGSVPSTPSENIAVVEGIPVLVNYIPRAIIPQPDIDPFPFDEVVDDTFYVGDKNAADLEMKDFDNVMFQLLTNTGPEAAMKAHDTKPSQLQKRDNRNTVVNGNLIVSGCSTIANVHITGNLIVDGEIRGKLVTEAGKADYAEWFAFLNDQDDIVAGQVVQLRSPQQRITLDTSHEDCGPILIVSTSPSVAAGKPDTNEKGDFCAFLGQVPVKVKGPIFCGDVLFPSGFNDGFAVSHTTHYNQLKERPEGCNSNTKDMEPIATAIEGCGPGEHTILSFIRWQHNIKDQAMREKTKKLNYSVTLFWMTNVILCFDYLTSFSFYFSKGRDYFIWDQIQVGLDLALIANFIVKMLGSHYSELFNSLSFVGLLGFKLLRLAMAVIDCVVLLSISADTDLANIGNMKSFGMNSKRLFVNSIHILSSVMFLVMVVNLINAWKAAYPEESKSAQVFQKMYRLFGELIEMFPNSLTNIQKKLSFKEKTDPKKED